MSSTDKKFDGSDYVPERDDNRLSAQHALIFNLMSDEKPRTLQEIYELTGAPPASISAQLRHMRKVKFGSHTVNKLYLGSGLYIYTLIVNKDNRNV